MELDIHFSSFPDLIGWLVIVGVVGYIAAALAYMVVLWWFSNH